MNFSILSDCHAKWQDILVIGKTIERDGKKPHSWHVLPLKGCVIDMPVSPDTTKTPAELFLYYERVNERSETVL